MIKYQYSKNILIKKKIDINENIKKSDRAALTILKRFFLIINNFLCIPALKLNRIILDDLFYSSKFTLILNLKLFQIPSMLGAFFTLDESKEEINISKRLKIAPLRLKNRNLMNYILENIFLEIPKCYLEDFNYIEKKNFLINNFKKKLIVVNTSYAFNERFKFWLAKMKKNRSKIFVTNHGGFLSPDVDGFLRFEKRISDKYLTWNKLYQDKNGVNLPQIQFKKYKSIKQIKRESCLIIASGVLKYAHKLQPWPYSENFKIVQNFHIDLIKNLKDKIKKKIIFRAMEEDGYFKITNNIKKRFKFLSISNAREISLSKEFESAKILVCSYPETPINDALYSNIPFVILYPENLYSDFKKYKKILLPLKKNQILFNDPKKLSIHLNNIWNDPGKWWFHKKTQDCIKKFKYETTFDQNKPLNKWADYLSQFK
jgi:putative transferase (TIGR04331 family)